jgi:serine/threonine protein kinase
MEIGQYRVLEALGQGGFAQVYKVSHELTQDIYALKWLHPSERFGFASDSEAYEEIKKRFIEDARNLWRLGNIWKLGNIVY